MTSSITGPRPAHHMNGEGETPEAVRAIAAA